MNEVIIILLLFFVVILYELDFSKFKYLFERRYKPINDIDLVAFRYRKYAYLKSIE